MKFEFYISCFDRVLTIELKNPKDKAEAQWIMEKAYDEWVYPLNDLGDVCCEEYICEFLEKYGIEFTWIEAEE